MLQVVCCHKPVVTDKHQLMTQQSKGKGWWLKENKSIQDQYDEPQKQLCSTVLHVQVQACCKQK